MPKHSPSLFESLPVDRDRLAGITQRYHRASDRQVVAAFGALLGALDAQARSDGVVDLCAALDVAMVVGETLHPRRGNGGAK